MKSRAVPERDGKKSDRLMRERESKRQTVKREEQRVREEEMRVMDKGQEGTHGDKG